MFKKVLVPLDGSPLAEKALPFAAFLAKRQEGELFLVRAVEVWASTVHDAIEKALEKKPQAEAELQAAAARLATDGLKVEQAVYAGEPASIIETAASSHEADLIVVSTHGRSGFARWAYGSVAERVLHTTSKPVLLVPAQTEATWQPDGPRTIILPLDESALSEQAIEPAQELARALGASITVVRVIEPPNMAIAGSAMGVGYYEPFDIQAWVDDAKPYAEGVAARLQQEGFSATAETLAGYPAATIQAVAAARNAAAIVMASHGRTGLARLALGSVAVGVVQRAAAAVLIVRPTGVAAEAPGPRAQEATPA